MKILLVVHGYPPEKVGGTETYTRSLARALNGTREVVVFTRTASPGDEYEVLRRDDEGVPVISVRNTYSIHSDYEMHYKNPHIEKAFAETLKEFRPDVVHFTYLLGGLSASYLDMAVDLGFRTILTITDFHFICAWGQLLTPEGRDCPGPEEGLRCSVCFSGEDPYTGLGSLKRWWIKRLPFKQQVERLDAPGLMRMRKRMEYLKGVLSRADFVISPTKYLQNIYRQWGIDSTFIPFGIDKSLFSGFTRSPSQMLRLGFIGRLLPLKGLHVLVEALAGLQPDLPPWELQVYADDSGVEEKRYLEMITEMAPASVKFRGTFRVDDVKKVYEDMDALVMPSLWAENSPMALLYALHTGTPVIAADIAGVREVVGDCGAFLYPPRDISALQVIIRDVLTNPSSLAGRDPVDVPGMEDHVQYITKIYGGDLS